MAFLAPWFLGGLALLGLPFWLHLLQQQSNGVGVEDARLLLVCMYGGIYFALASFCLHARL